ncbi:MAG: hypothetical protein ACRDQZ_23750 [Mycobacteriales bacterium]
MGRWTFRVGEHTHYTTGEIGRPAAGGGGGDGLGCFLVLLGLLGLAALLAIPYGVAVLVSLQSSDPDHDPTAAVVGLVTLVVEIVIVIGIVRARRAREDAESFAEWEAQAPVRARDETIATGIKFYEEQGLTILYSDEFPCPVCDRGPGLACRNVQPAGDVHTGRCVAHNHVTGWRSRCFHDQLQSGDPDWNRI